jgi:DNA-binding transcriptional ArsR family regulator
VYNSRSRIAALLDEGLSVSQIARHTGLTDNTVRYHRERILASPAAEARMPRSLAPTYGRSATPSAGDPPSTRARVRALLDAGLARCAVARELGLSKSTVSYHARRLGFTIDARPARRFDWAAIQAYYDAGHGLAECSARFGFSPSAWCGAVKRGAIVSRPRAKSIDELLSAPGPRAYLKRRLLRAGLLPRCCQQCGISEWRGKPLSLHLHHINGDGRDNRLRNLQILCPNCHSQTDSWGGRNGKRCAATS